MYNALDENAVLEGVKKFGPAPGARKMMDNEMLHAMESIESGTYVTYWYEKKKIECGRIGSNSKCFCGHLFSCHNDKYFGKKFDVSCKNCPCKVFKFVPTRPEECGMYWLVRRKDFNVHKWRAPCKCNHTHEDHMPNYPLRCTKCGNCDNFRAYFACISCDGAWEDHEVLYETEMERKQLGKKIRDDYKPLSTNSAIQYEVFENKNRSVDPNLVRPRPKPGEQVDRVPFMPMIRFKPAQMVTGPDGKATFQPPSSTFSFNPVYDDIPVGQNNTGQNQIVKPPQSNTTIQKSNMRVQSTGKPAFTAQSKPLTKPGVTNVGSTKPTVSKTNQISKPLYKK
ncbi:hypothetical protein TTHERM_00318550 (macronuclear) [Tetrahymena thermophila SB210]|uniref:Uncharacterized protein n=1 Tax=Tetrahymena thermophila (strain SB210) TaxID=312017 RepID=I7M9A1_TETTS|nr:hypothetical protein TTHERM_00318550 [Tetrahymena thermophila SB210]EAS01192.2 hypothetical protein TTHERM_00318550 [Tetrahymena thermophila SB210]|eukprot:XP_001021437.2 hypothetical protein TTHERM_00318550 [Tetrahymena thermophila SB210]